MELSTIRKLLLRATIKPLLIASGLAISSTSFAVTSPELTAGLNKIMPGITPSSIVETPIKGLYEVSFGSSIYYFNRDASIMVRGEMIDIKTKVNLTKKKKELARGKQVQSLDEDKMIVFPAENEKAKVTVFTDISCPYCVKLHEKIPEYNAAGITIRYMAFPRSGPGTSSFRQTENIWCSEDKNQAMTDAKSGQMITAADCDNPVEEHYKIGQGLGVGGTPAMFLTDGSFLPGYYPPEKLIARLKIGKTVNNVKPAQAKAKATSKKSTDKSNELDSRQAKLSASIHESTDRK